MVEITIVCKTKDVHGNNHIIVFKTDRTVEELKQALSSPVFQFDKPQGSGFTFISTSDIAWVDTRVVE